MKRQRNIWPEVTSEDNALRAVIEGTRFKRGKREVEMLLSTDSKKWRQIDIGKAREYVRPICLKLQNKTWKHAPPRHRLQYCRNRASSKGKWRDLYIPTLEDHIVAHMLMQGSMKAFMRGMHPNCCGSIPGRGIKHILKKVNHWFRDDLECRYFVKLDIRKFFDNIDGEILKQKLARKIKDKDALWAWGQIIDSAPMACPVGYYTSPWLANLYLEELDWFIAQQLYKVRRGKRINYVRHQLRYIDDILLIGTSKRDMDKAVHAIAEYLQKNYGLEIKPTWEIKKIGKHELVAGEWQMISGTYWCDIGGYKFCKDATILRDGIYLHTKRLAKKIYKQGYATEHQCRSLTSQIGWATHCDSTHFFEDDIRPYVNIRDTRRTISNVDKNGKRGGGEASRKRTREQICDRPERV